MRSVLLDLVVLRRLNSKFILISPCHSLSLRLVPIVQSCSCCHCHYLQDSLCLIKYSVFAKTLHPAIICSMVSNYFSVLYQTSGCFFMLSFLPSSPTSPLLKLNLSYWDINFESTIDYISVLALETICSVVPWFCKLQLSYVPYLSVNLSSLFFKLISNRLKSLDHHVGS